jgi:hypothetical protein
MGLVIASNQLLRQLKNCLNQLTNDEYTEKLAIFSSSTIGQHTRHILEFHQALLNVDKIINYDLRQRNLQIENDKEYMLQIIDSLTKELKSLNLSKKIILQGTLGGVLNTVESNLGRELLYVTEHAVHHMAILKMGIVHSFCHIQFEENFGVAESTINYQQCAQ